MRKLTLLNVLTLLGSGLMVWTVLAGFCWGYDLPTPEKVRINEELRFDSAMELVYSLVALAFLAAAMALAIAGLCAKDLARKAAWLFVAAVVVAGVLARQCFGAKVRTPNFIIETRDAQNGQAYAAAAERYRKDLAVEWLGKEMPTWSRPCPMTVHAGAHLGAGGATSFCFDHGEVFGWHSAIQGTPERILDSVLPHEITHMVLASHFRRPLPRWADEGAAISVEIPAEHSKQRQHLIWYLQTGRGIAFDRMFAMKEYPRDIMPLYAQGFSATDYLIQQGGRREFVRFLEEAFRTSNASAALQTVYRIESPRAFQGKWLAWVRQGFPRLRAIVATTRPRSTPITVASTGDT